MPDRNISEVPEILDLTAKLLHESEVEVDPKADMLLLFYVSGGTVLGALAGSIAWMLYSPLQTAGLAWMLCLLGSALIGCLAGCSLVVSILNGRGLVRWERDRALKRRSSSG